MRLTDGVTTSLTMHSTLWLLVNNNNIAILFISFSPSQFSHLPRWWWESWPVTWSSSWPPPWPTSATWPSTRSTASEGQSPTRHSQVGGVIENINNILSFLFICLCRKQWLTLFHHNNFIFHLKYQPSIIYLT